VAEWRLNGNALPTGTPATPAGQEAAAREQMSYRGFLAELLMAESTTAPAAAPNAR
jgi:hypothetical protein